MHGIYVLVTLYQLLLVFTDLTLYDTSVTLPIGLVMKKYYYYLTLVDINVTQSSGRYN